MQGFFLNGRFLMGDISEQGESEKCEEKGKFTGSWQHTKKKVDNLGSYQHTLKKLAICSVCSAHKPA